MYTVIKRMEVSAAHSLNLSYQSKCEIEDFQKEMKKYQLLKAEHNTLKEQHETLKSRMSGVLTSWSYKLGRGITAIPRKIRCIIKK